MSSVPWVARVGEIVRLSPDADFLLGVNGKYQGQLARVVGYDGLGGAKPAPYTGMQGYRVYPLDPNPRDVPMLDMNPAGLFLVFSHVQPVPLPMFSY